MLMKKCNIHDFVQKVPKKIDAHSSISKQRFIEVSKNKYKASASILYWPTMHQLLIFKSFQGLFDKDVPHWLAKGPQKSPEAGFKLFKNKRSMLDEMSEWSSEMLQICHIFFYIQRFFDLLFRQHFCKYIISKDSKFVKSWSV